MRAARILLASCSHPARILLACALAASSLSLVGARAVSAANTSGELFVDPDDGQTVLGQGGVRPLAGRDRYDTSVLAAWRFARQRGGLGAVSTVVLASGASIADTFAAAGLAGYHKAPVMLTQPDRLPQQVAEFIDAHDVSTVIVMGGPAAVGERVVAEAASLEAEPTVRRVAGADRYGTAAAAARELPGDTAWCGAEGSAALLVNGDDKRLAEAVGLGSVAFARELPILLTRRDELPDAAAQYLRQAGIERVVIVGGTWAVSGTVVSPLLAEGVDEVNRVAGSSATIGAAAAAQLLTATCRDELMPSQSVVALADPRSPIEAAAAAPLLAVGIDDSGPVPLLLAGGPLPLSVRSFLARTPRDVGDRRNHLLVAAIGEIDDETMAEAIAAAASARPLSAQIRVAPGDDMLRINFSESLEVDVSRFKGRVRDLLYVNGAPAWIEGIDLLPRVSSDPCGLFSSVEVTVHDPFEAGDLIVLETAEGWHSTNDDRRSIGGDIEVVQPPRSVSGRPSITAIALVGQTDLWVSVQAPQFRDPAVGDVDEITVNSGRIRVIADSGAPVGVGSPTRVRLDRFLGTALYSFPLLSEGGQYALAPGDRVVLRSGVAINERRQRSASRGVTVTAPTARLAIESVLVGTPNPGVDDSVRTARPEKIDGISTRAKASLGASVDIVAKWSGSAAGAAGNGWRIDSQTSMSAFGEVGDDPPVTQVWVESSSRRITIRHIDAPGDETRSQTYGELVQMLNSNGDFSRHFSAELRDPCAGDDETVDLGEAGFTGDIEFEGGMSSVSFLVPFSDYVTEYLGAGESLGETPDALIRDILGGLLPADATWGPEQLEIAAPVPGRHVVFRFTTTEPEHTIAQAINVRRELIELREGLARGSDDPNTETDESVSAGRRLFVVSSRDSRLHRDWPRGANSSP
ncbi:cell wall-binding repeat-containing protein [Candidatus Poriferisodalis sp.]|uniref:cell wall-binding repeat-containing protein n=1 Tax=Candidatus Poriferisodalis sp. TaxID=3101277 RepID=UPI003B0153D6